MKKKLSKQTWILLYTLSWFIGILVAVGMHLMDVITPMYTKVACFIGFRDVPSFLIVTIFTGFPFCASFFWYAKIFFNLHAVFPGNTEAEIRARGVAQSLIRIYVFFLVCFGPAFLYSFFTQVGIITYENAPSFELTMYIGTFLNASCNPYLAIYLFPQVGKEAKKLIMFCGGDKIDPDIATESGHTVSASIGEKCSGNR